ncbi:hypothetical protein DNTS_022715 [Danionella cerebrum]|uniref:Uncharacterized protein n=1 Tax=Danionella cerebrum TaxID=2873325 RepID=A0A553MY01_9TELE|nr:hypothetical protein DNTS_022715 [Danionella translucida]
MVCDLVLSSVWLLFLIFWLESISVWLFLCLCFQDRTVLLPWGSGDSFGDSEHFLYLLSSSYADLRK